MGKNITTEQLKNNRFYVLYFSFYKQPSDNQWESAINGLQAMINKVIESSSFKNFMNHE